MILTAIAAMAANRTIGVDNDLPWNLPEDLKFFRNKTKASVLIMGRKTFDSIKKPLPGRYHIVITRNPDFHYAHDHVVVVQSLDQAISVAGTLIPPWPEEVFVVGGGEIYRQSMNRIDRIYLTRIEKDYEGHASFPEFESTGEFRLTQVQPASTNVDSASQVPGLVPRYQFETWIREGHGA